MPIYIGLFKFTDKGLANIQDSPKRIAAGLPAAEQMGIRVIGTWLTLGQYDLVSVAEAPDDETLARFALAYGMQGHAITQTLRAFTLEEFERIVSGLP